MKTGIINSAQTASPEIESIFFEVSIKRIEFCNRFNHSEQRYTGNNAARKEDTCESLIEYNAPDYQNTQIQKTDYPKGKCGHRR